MTGKIQNFDSALLQVIALFLGNRDNRACSYAQRKLGIGYNEAARHIETLEGAGILSPANNVGKRTLHVENMREAKQLLGMEVKS